MARVAFIGTGAMGSSMAGRLLDTGHDVVVHTRTPSRAVTLLGRGATWADTPREAVADAEVAIAMVNDDTSSRAVWTGPDGALGAPTGTERPLLIECSTLSHGWVRELSAEAAACGWRYLDAPVTALPQAAARGALTFLVGADADVLDSARALLGDMGDVVLHFGAVGTGTAYKLMINLIGAIQIGSIAEGLALAERAGLDMDLVLRAVSTGQAASPQVVRNAAFMVSDTHTDPILFTTHLRRKDVAYALEMAAGLGAPVRFGETSLAMLDEVISAGLGEVNESVIIEVARRGGTEG